MAKDKQGKAGDKSKKVTKKLRKAGDAAVKLARQPVVSELVAAALTAAAASLSQTKTARKAAREAGDAAEGAVRETAAISQSVKRALLDAARSLIDEFDDRPRERTLARSEPQGQTPARTGGRAKTKGGGKKSTR